MKRKQGNKLQALIVSGGHLEDSFAAAYIGRHSFDLTVAADSGLGGMGAYQIILWEILILPTTKH